jgi:hypothetical protein
VRFLKARVQVSPPESVLDLSFRALPGKQVNQRNLAHIPTKDGISTAGNSNNSWKKQSSLKAKNRAKWAKGLEQQRPSSPSRRH